YGNCKGTIRREAGEPSGQAMRYTVIFAAVQPPSMDNAFIATTFDWDDRTPKDWQTFLNRAFRKIGIPVLLTPPTPPMSNVESRMNLFHLVEQTAVNKVPGDVVDVGCNAGDSTIVMQKVITTLA